MWLDCLVFCDYGFSVSALWCPLATPTILLGFLLPWTCGISSWLLQQSSAAAPYLGQGVSPHGRPSWLWTCSSSSQPSCARTAAPDLRRVVVCLGPRPDLGCGVASVHTGQRSRGSQRFGHNWTHEHTWADRLSRKSQGRTTREECLRVEAREGSNKGREIIFVLIRFIFPSWHESRYGNANIFLCPEKSIIDFWDFLPNLFQSCIIYTSGNATSNIYRS